MPESKVLEYLCVLYIFLVDVVLISINKFKMLKLSSFHNQIVIIYYCYIS